MPKPFYIGISGPAGGGKDTAATVIRDELRKIQLTSRTQSFAQPLKDLCATLFGMTFDEVNTLEGKKKASTAYPSLTNREILQKVGTESFRDVISPNIWVDVMERQTAYSGYDVIVIPDVRFENEAQFCKDNGILLHVIPTFPGFEDITPAGTTAHASEAGYPQTPDFALQNDSTEDAFAKKIQFVCQSIICPVIKIAHEEGNKFIVTAARQGIVDTLMIFDKAAKESKIST